MKMKCLTAALLIVNLVPLHAAEFFRLPSGGDKLGADLNDISNDATIAVGSVYNHATGVLHAAAWRRTATGYQLTVLDQTKGDSVAEAVSADGSVIVGWIHRGERQLAARWVDGVVELIGETVEPYSQSRAVAVSDDGSVVVFNMDYLGAAVWSQARGVELLGDAKNPNFPAPSKVKKSRIILDDPPHSVATCISGDGRTVGGVWTNGHTSVPVIWNVTGMVKMPGGPEGFAWVSSMSRNGEVIAGYTHTPHPESSDYFFSEATCWDASGGVRRMGHLPGGRYSKITSCSANGEILAGKDSVGDDDVPAIWIKNHGPVSFRSYLKKKYDLDLPSWVTDRLYVSPSGRQFGGDGWIIDTRKSKIPEISVTQSGRSELKDGKASKFFGRCKVGILGKKETFTIRNAGNAELTGLSIALRGKHASGFRVSSLRLKSLPPGATTTFKVAFKPGTKGDQACILRIRSNDADENPFDIKLSGTGILAK